MEIILSNRVESLTGTLLKGCGYHIVHRKNGFFGRRNSKGYVPEKGHLVFIVRCAHLAREGVYVSDIRISGREIIEALREAGQQNPHFFPELNYNAEQVWKLLEYSFTL